MLVTRSEGCAHVPIRTCIGCRQRRPRMELRRCVMTGDGTIEVDVDGVGRGAWLCGPDCLDLAVRRRAFARAWRRAMPDDPNGGIERTIREQLERPPVAGRRSRTRHERLQEGGDARAEVDPST